MTVMPVEHVDVDVVVVGSGFAGALTSMVLRRTGRRVAMVDRGRHPRFAIGESSTPLANLLLEELCDRYELPRVRVFSKWGTWQRARPDVACGLKRGFTFFFHTPGDPFDDDARHDRQLMVAASPHDEIADTHWYRASFDAALVEEAQASGVLAFDETRLDTLRQEGDVITLDGVRDGRALRIAARFLIDASGPRGFLHHALGLPEQPLRWMPPTQGLYTHFEQVTRWDALIASDGIPPYPPDTAALHHVFPGGWIWLLRFNNGITSAGAALTNRLASRIGVHDAQAAWSRLLQTLPSVRAQFDAAHPTRPFVHAARLAFRSAALCGQNWAMLPSAAGIIDPLLSSGFPLTLLGIARLVDILETTSPGPARDTALRAYAEITREELDVSEGLIGALYAVMDDPALFKKLSLSYFAAASYSEAARRLGRPERAEGFLLCRHPRFGPEFRACTTLAAARPRGDARADLMARIARLIEPFDVAGLLDSSRRDWYPVRAADLTASASKLDAAVEDIYALLAGCGFADSHRLSMSSAGGPTTNNA